MAFTLWLSADEERILEGIMREEGTHSKQQAVIAAIREKGAKLTTERQGLPFTAERQGLSFTAEVRTDASAQNGADAF
jgi:hypothetical protein